MKTFEEEEIKESYYFEIMERKRFRNWLEARRLLKKMLENGWKKIADVGCGPAQITRMMGKMLKRYAFKKPSLQLLKDVQIDCFDIDEKVIALAEAEAKKEGLFFFKFYPVPFEEVVPSNPTYDLIYLRFVLHHITAPLEYLTLILERLNRYGEIYIKDILKDSFAGRLKLILSKRKFFRGNEVASEVREGFVKSYKNSMTISEVREFFKHFSDLDIDLKVGQCRIFWEAIIKKR